MSSRRRAKKVASLTPRAAQKARTDWPDCRQAATVARQNCSRAWLRRRVFSMEWGLLADEESPDRNQPRRTPHHRTFTDGRTDWQSALQPPVPSECVRLKSQGV